MRFGKSFLAIAAVLAVATTAQASEYRTFKQDGVTYTYRVIDKGETQVIVGKSQLLGQTRTFKLKVQNGKVRGDVDGRNVAFATDEARAQNVQLASD